MSDKQQTVASIFPPKRHGVQPPVDPRLVAIVRKIEQELGMKVLCLVQVADGDEMVSQFSPWLHSKLLQELQAIPRGEPIAVLLHSPGGDAHTAFRMAKAIARHCGEFTVVIPRYAKSAATLFSLGASRIIFGEYAEFGPIDVQLEDFEHERQISALEMVQSLERLNSEAMQAMDTMMSLLIHRSRKRIETLLPSVLKYAADVTRPIFEKIDTISFTYHARLLKIGEDYAKLLLLPRYENAHEIAIALTRGYPDHGFVIDFDEAARLGLQLEAVPDALREPLGPFLASNTKSTVLGFLKDTPHAQEKTQAPASGSQARPAPSEPAGRNGRQRRTGNRVR